MDGTKAAKARALNTRVVHPDMYAHLLDHLQPALSRDVRVLPKTRQPATLRHAAGIEAPPGQTASESLAASVGPNPATVRAWARANGIEVGTRGRLHQDVFDAYAAAHTDN